MIFMRTFSSLYVIISKLAGNSTKSQECENSLETVYR